MQQQQSLGPRRMGATGDDDFVFDEATGEWISAADAAAKTTAAPAAGGAVEVRDSVGNLLADGDSVTLSLSCSMVCGKGVQEARGRGSAASPHNADHGGGGGGSGTSCPDTRTQRLTSAWARGGGGRERSGRR